MTKNKLLLLLALLLTAATGAWAQEQWDVVWDFTAWSTETVTALKADAAASKLEGWSDVEKTADAEAGAEPTEAAKDNCFWFAGTVNEDGSLSANGAVIKELKGLKFNSDYAAKRSLAIAVNYPSTSLGDYAGGAYLWLGGGGSKQNCPCFTIPGVKAGSKITIEVESNKPSDGRGIGLYKNSYAAENLIGEQFKPTAKEAKTWEIAEDCDVVVWNTSGCHIYTIKVKAPAAAPSSGYTVSMKDGVKDADKWTVKVGEGQAQALPIGGLKGDGSETVTLQYNGRLKVKGVKAVKKAKPAAVTYIGTKSPTEAKAVGDIVFSDGSATAYTSGLTLTDEQKAAAVAVIFYAGSASDILGAKTLGVGLKNTNDETTKYLAFARNASGTAEGYNTNITAIQCTPSESGDGKAATATFTGDLDGSDNWTALCAAVNDEGTSGNYPAWEWVNAYATTANLTGEYASGWYLPTVAELCMLYRAKDTVNAALEKADGTIIVDNYYWSSSQSSSTNNKAWMVKFDIGKLIDTYKGNKWYVCGVRAFN